MRLIDADKLYPDCLTKTGRVAISQSQIAEAPTVEQFDDTELQRAIGYSEGYLKGKQERPTGEWIEVIRRISDNETETHWECSKCHNFDYRWGKAEFCSFCGADMRVKHELNNELNELKEGKDE